MPPEAQKGPEQTGSPGSEPEGQQAPYRGWQGPSPACTMPTAGGVWALGLGAQRKGSEQPARIRSVLTLSLPVGWAHAHTSPPVAGSQGQACFLLCEQTESHNGARPCSNPTPVPMSHFPLSQGDLTATHPAWCHLRASSLFPTPKSELLRMSPPQPPQGIPGFPCSPPAARPSSRQT